MSGPHPSIVPLPVMADHEHQLARIEPAEIHHPRARWRRYRVRLACGCGVSTRDDMGEFAAWLLDDLGWVVHPTDGWSSSGGLVVCALRVDSSGQPMPADPEEDL